MTVLGFASGNVFHTLVAAFRIAAIFETSPLAFALLEYLGIVYLLFLAYKIIIEQPFSSSTLQKAHAQTGSSLYFRSMLMNILNPKVALFFLAFLPQFILASSTSIWSEILFYGFLSTSMVIVIFRCIGLFSSSLSKLITAESAIYKNFRWIAALIFTSLAFRLFFDQ